MRHILTILAVILSGFIASGNAQTSGLPQNYQGLLWEISGNGLEKPSYLYGTMHVSEKMVFQLSDSFFVALKSADVVALETDFSTWIEEYLEEENADLSLLVSESSRYNSYSDGQGIYSTQVFYPFVEKESFPSYLKAEPGLTNPMLYRSSSYSDDYEEDTYLDLFIYQSGKKLGKRVVGLEDYFQSNRIILKGSIETYLDLQKNKDKKKDDDYESRYALREYISKTLLNGMSTYEAMQEAYRSGNLDLMDTLTRLDESEEIYNKYMLDARNAVHVRSMDSIMKTQTLFAAVGAAHLPGKNGVISMLREKGYTLRAVPHRTNSPSSVKLEIDNMRVPVVFEEQQPEDKSFSVKVPGKLYEVESYRSSKDFLVNDFSNGSYYYIQEIKMFGSLFAKTPEDIMYSMDSLVYENTPGKILDKKLGTTPEGYPYIDITNKKRRGDVQKMRLIFTDTRLLIFKVSGVGDYLLNGTEADTFFTSIRIGVGPENRNLSFPTYGFSVQPPGQSTLYDAPPSKYTNFIEHEWTSTKDKNLFWGNHASITDFKYLEEDSFEVSVLPAMLSAQSGWELDTIWTGKDKMGWYSRGILHTENDTEIHTFARLRDNQYFFLVAQSGIHVAENYFSSLKFFEGNTSENYKLHQDTTQGFQIDVPKIENKQYAVYESLLEEYKNTEIFDGLGSGYSDYGYDYYDSYETEDFSDVKENPYLGSRHTTSVKSGEHDEMLIVNVATNGILDRPVNRESLEKDGKLRKDLQFNIRDLESKFPGYTGYEVTASRLGTSRILKNIVYTSENKTYYLTYTYDSTLQPGAFIRHGIETFSILQEGKESSKEQMDRKEVVDTTIRYFLTNYFTADSLEQKMMRQAFYKLTFRITKEHRKEVNQFIQHPDFFGLKPYYTNQMLEIAGQIADENLYKVLRTLYLNYSDSTEIQKNILSGLAYSNQLENLERMIELMRIDLPVVSSYSYSSYSGFSQFFTALEDSVELLPKLLPELMPLCNNEDLRKVVYPLIASAIEKDALNPKSYSKYFPDMLAGARYKLKKFIYEKSEDDDRYYSYSYNSDWTLSGYSDYYDSYDDYGDTEVMEELTEYYFEYNGRRSYSNSEEKTPRISRNLDSDLQGIYDASLLCIPYYKKNKDATAFLEKVVAQKNLTLQVMVYPLLWKKGLAPDRTFIEERAKDIKTRLALYNQLQFTDQLHLFPKEWATQEQLLISRIFYSKDVEEGDSLELILKVDVDNGKTEGPVYFFQLKKAKEYLWTAYASKIQPKEENEINYYSLSQSLASEYETVDEIETDLNAYITELQIGPRKRIERGDFEKRKSESYYYDDYYWDY